MELLPYVNIAKQEYTILAFCDQLILDIFFCLNELLNLGLHAYDTRLILHWGFAENQGDGGVLFCHPNGNDELYGNNVENQSNVHMLAFACGESPLHYFRTQICNYKFCWGLRQLRKLITFSRAITMIY